jgi:hypothetical protein
VVEVVNEMEVLAQETLKMVDLVVVQVEIQLYGLLEQGFQAKVLVVA